MQQPSKHHLRSHGGAFLFKFPCLAGPVLLRMPVSFTLACVLLNTPVSPVGLSFFHFDFYSEMAALPLLL